VRWSQSRRRLCSEGKGHTSHLDQKNNVNLSYNFLNRLLYSLIDEEFRDYERLSCDRSICDERILFIEVSDEGRSIVTSIALRSIHESAFTSSHKIQIASVSEDMHILS
jgi:hypothetical protein